MERNEELGKGSITRAALGRLGVVGELYDATTESFSSRSLFKSSLPRDAIESRDLGNMEFDYKFTENIWDWFELINVEAELQLGVLCGLINLDGSGKFLTEQKKSEKVVSCSVMCKIQTVCEKFYAAWSEVLHHVDLAALEDGRSTHVIVECYWGANCLLSMECECESESEKKEVKGRLAADISCLGKLIKGKAGGELENLKKNLLQKDNLRIKVNADVVPENGWPISVESFCQFVKEVPKLLKNLNEGKGKPLKYVMIPLSILRKVAKIECDVEKLVVDINESFVLSSVYVFDDIAGLKRKFNDCLSEMKKYEKYVANDDYENSKKQLQKLQEEETRLKEIIAENWGCVKSGKTPLRDLIRSVEKFKSQMNLISYETYLDQCEKILMKLSFVKCCLSKGIKYLGLGDTFSGLQIQNLTSEFIVFVTSKETRETELSQKTLVYFLTLMENPATNHIFVVVDLDYDIKFLDNKIRAPKCVHLKGSDVLSQDLYGEYLSESQQNFARPKEDGLIKHSTHKPGNRVPLEMVCPNHTNGGCGGESIQWICFRCKTIIDYGFDDYFYCSCGKCPSSFFIFRCHDPKHGNVYVAPEEKFLKNMLSKMRPRKEMNILLLGQSGVGKSTWINSIVNYSNYATLEEAETNEVFCAIPVAIPVYDSKKSTREIFFFGKSTHDEDTEIGNSGTQRSRCYFFYWEDRLVRLIDTPGIGDTRGISHDEKNLNNVLETISYLKELHGVCILVRANENRLTPFFRYLFKEFLVRLHKSVTRNIVFCFTNARNTLYSPGSASLILEKLFKELNIEKELSLGLHNSFCLDNEAFIYLCTQKHSETCRDENLKASFSKSWIFSQKETERLLETVKNFEPHPIEETLALYKARIQILGLSRILADISKTLQLNIVLMEEKQRKLQNSNMKLNQLEKLLNIEEIQLEPESLPYPRTVCTKPSCVNYISYKSLDITETQYSTVCHEKCYLAGVVPQSVYNSQLRNCSSMDSQGICKNCGCLWEHHMHITFLQKRVNKIVKNSSIEADMMEEKEKQTTVENFLKELESYIAQYKKEQNIIITATAKFGHYLKFNAITVYNDSLADYLKYLIQEEENKPQQTDLENRLLLNLKETLARYTEEVKILEDVIGETNHQEEPMSLEEFNGIANELFGLKLSGESIKKNLELHEKAGDILFLEIPIAVKKKMRVEKSPDKARNPISANNQLTLTQKVSQKCFTLLRLWLND